MDLTKLNFLSSSNYLKRDDELSGGTNLALGGYYVTTYHTITHNYGYVPFVEVFGDVPGSGLLYQGNAIDRYTETSLSGNDLANPKLVFWVTTTTLTVGWSNQTAYPGQSGTREIQWIIYKDYAH